MINLKRLPLLILCLIAFSNAGISQLPLYRSTNINQAFKNGTRAEDGQPGPNYWANFPSYKMDLNFDPEKTLLEGAAQVEYTNNSPDTLKELTIALLDNIYKEKAKRDWNINTKAMHDGTVVTQFLINGDTLDLKGENIRISNTNMYVQLSKPILPKSTTQLSFKWHVLFPPKAVIRSGNYGDSTFFISYFYPKLAVYDDIDGWDKNIYTGYTEFYGEYADYDVNITVPGDFFVWSTGELQNAGKVLTPIVYDRWTKAATSDKTIHIIEVNEVGSPKTYGNKKAKTWSYKASNVTDYAFAVSNRFAWDGRSVEVDKKTKRRTRINTAYKTDSKDYNRVADITADALGDYSNDLPGIPYPYPVMSIFNGVAGMEYPMMCNDDAQDKISRTAGLTYHEIAHTYFPFYVGINERKYAWMDEGWASFFPPFNFDDYESSFNEYFKGRRTSYEGFAGTENEVPLMTLSKNIKGRSAYRHASYSRPFLAYYYLMEYLGKEKFKKALQGYMTTWAGKHPIPHDFFNSINHYSNENLNWFWRSWFLEKNHPDLAIGNLNTKGVEILNIGRLFLPIHLTIIYKDGHTQVVEKNLDIWKLDAEKAFISLENAQDIKSIQLGSWNSVDVDDSNNFKVFTNIISEPSIDFDKNHAMEVGADQYGMKKYVIAFLKAGPNRGGSKEERAELQRQHMANIVKMADAGQLVLAGPFLSDDDYKGIYIFNVETIEEAKNLTETDPAIQKGSLIMDLKEWYGSAALMDVNDIHKSIQEIKF